VDIRVECWFHAVARGGTGYFTRCVILAHRPIAGEEICFTGELPGGGWEVCLVSLSEDSDTVCCYLGDHTDLSLDWQALRASYLSAGWMLMRECVDADGCEDEEPPWLRDCRGGG
jgi:hypothetical protein